MKSTTLVSRLAASMLGVALLVLAVASGPSVLAGPGSVEIPPSLDNTLIEGTEVNSGGKAETIFAGRTGVFAGNTLRRAVLAFDVAGNVPCGATITDVTLTLTILQAGPESVVADHALHRLTNAWGEGASAGFGGIGAPAEPGDATWIHTFFPDMFWDSAGGDFAAGPGAVSPVGFNPLDTATWSSAQMVADVQAWTDDPSSNFGWLVRGDEANSFGARMFGSRENETISLRPVLAIEFTACVGDTNDSGAVDVEDLVNVILEWGCTSPPSTCDGDVNCDDVVDVQDLIAVILNWGDC